MPVKWLLGKDGERVTFDDAPAYFEREGIMPAFAVKAVIREYEGDKPSFHVRPSDVNPAMRCRRQRVWESNHDFGVSPLELESMMEGTALHNFFGTDEIEVPAADAKPERLEVCGVLQRGRIDFLHPDLIEDLKTATPFWITKYGAKGSGIKPWVDIWLPDPAADIASWQVQLSIYRVLLEKAGQPAPTKGRVWRRWAGVKADKARYQKFEFALLTEAELDARVGPWMRQLDGWLQAASKGIEEAWQSAAPDGLKFVGSRGNRWCCDRCPLKTQCHRLETMEVF